MKILHIADTHLGVKLNSFSNKARELIKQNIIDKTNEILNIVKLDNYDGIILSGDIFEASNISYYWINYFEKLFSYILNSGGFVVYLTGNHDYFINESYFYSSKNENFILINEEKLVDKIIDVKGEKLRIVGVGYSSNSPRLNATDLYKIDKKDIITIGVFHGVIDDEKTKYMYVNINELIGYYDYFAMGHVHSKASYNKIFSYPGSTFSQGFDETGEKGIIEVNISKDSLDSEFKSLINYEVISKEFSVEAVSYDDFLLKLGKLILDIDSEKTPIYDIKVNLKGVYFDIFTNEDDIKREIFNDELSRVKINFIKTKEEIKMPKEILNAIDYGIKQANIEDDNHRIKDELIRLLKD